MRLDTTTREFARKLLALSLDEVGQVSKERVGAILESLRGRPRRNLKHLLKNYLHCIIREVRKSEAVVEHTGEIGTTEGREIERALSSHYGRPITCVLQATPGLIAGVRVSVADDIYDTSVTGHLEKLAK